MSARERAELDTLLRALPLDLGGDVAAQRPLMEQLMTAHPLPDDVTTTASALGDVPVTVVDVAGTDASRTLLYFHGGAYAMGSAAAAAGLAAELARRADARAISVDYRLAPEHPFPSAIDDTLTAYQALLGTVPPERVVFAGESAGGGLAIATLLAARDAGLPLPAAAVVLSPWADLTLTAGSLAVNAETDPVLTTAALRRRASDYLATTDAKHPQASPARADLTGLPQLMIEVGSHEILLDDACLLATSAARAHVPVTLTVTPHVPHVFPAFADVLTEGAAALERTGTFLRTALTARDTDAEEQ